MSSRTPTNLKNTWYITHTITDRDTFDAVLFKKNEIIERLI